MAELVLDRIYKVYDNKVTAVDNLIFISRIRNLSSLSDRQAAASRQRSE
ncbi:hypothetical protein PO124_22070 [Bacillus licheniformis]|nr:hypothetical protein [Bacillus licheniformis]